MKVTEVNLYFAEITQIYRSDDPFNYMLEVYMYDYIALETPRRRYKLHHVAKTVMTGIYDVLSLDKDDDEHSISLNILLKN